MRRAWTAAAVGCLVAVCSGCSDPVTEIVLEVDSDLSVPTDLDSVAVAVTPPDMPAAEPRVAEADLTTEGGGLPRTLTLVHRGGPLGPWGVRVTGYDGAAEAVTTDLRVTFEEGRSLRLHVVLWGSCADGPSCGTGRTCADGSCRSSDVRPCEYEGRSCNDGDGGVLDDAGGPTDGGGPADSGGPDSCTPTDEVCNGLDDDCDSAIDEDFDFETDPMHCGRCDRVCPTTVDNASGSTCEAGTCVLDCDPGFGDCNRDPADGCEVDIDTDMSHCGACGAFCPAAGTFHAANAVCSGGRCLLSCDVDWGDCDDDRSTGCETHVSVDRNHCGTCDNPCPDGQMCRSGACS